MILFLGQVVTCVHVIICHWPKQWFDTFHMIFSQFCGFMDCLTVRFAEKNITLTLMGCARCDNMPQNHSTNVNVCFFQGNNRGK